MAENVEKILDIKVNYNDAIKKIVEYREQIDDLKEAEKGYKQQLKDGEITRKQYNELTVQSKLRITELNQSVRAITKQLELQRKEEKANEGSLNQLRAQISQLTTAYDDLSEAERESASGKAMQQKIADLTNKLKGQEEATERYQRNVGNYENSLSPLFDSLEQKLEVQTKRYEELLEAQGEMAEETKKAKKAMEEAEEELNNYNKGMESGSDAILGFISAGTGLDASILTMIGQFKTFGEGAKAAGTMVKGLGAQLVKLMANPIVAFLAVLAAAIMAVAKGISSSEENTARWNKVMAPLNRMLDAGVKILQDFAGWILSAVEAGGKMLAWVSNMLEKLPLLGQYFEKVNKENEQYIKMAEESYSIDKDARKLQIDNAKNALKIAQLKAKADDELNVSAEERMKAIKEANKLEEAASRRNYQLAKRRYDLLVQQNAMADNTKETNDAIAQAEVEMYNALTEYHDKRGELLGREVSLANEIKQKEKEKADAAKEAYEKSLEIKRKEVEEIRKAEDELLKLVKDGREKESQEIRYQYDRQIQDLRTRLAQESDLTKKAREAINTQIIALEKQKNAELEKLSEEALAKEIENRRALIETALESVKQGSLEELNYKLQLLQTQREQELADKELTEEMKTAIVKKYNKLTDELYIQHEKDLNQKLAEAEALRMENEILQMQERGATELEILQEQANQKLELLNSIQQQEGESEEEFLNRRLEAQQAYTDAKQSISEKEVEIEEAKTQALAGMTNSLIGLLDAIGEKNRGFAIASKVLALAEIAINTGKAIAAGVAQAQSVPFPANIAAIATTVSTILANITTAISTVKSAKFATGGLVTGPGTGTSDSIPAQLSNGESVMTAKATEMFSPLLSSFNQMGGGVPIGVSESSSQAIGEDMMARAFAKGMKNIPSPVVSVEEINRVSNRVKILEGLGNV